ncbi:MAG TPA: hypothetical protein VNJ54_11875 [Plantibacter sp.]|uniref:hypothetical protein n=1 Tax=unclassified Plantibacter TaxID=2624265 RepID=UPI002B9BCE3B|nr:hypothetical protein [Plantibacter sp.]
MTEEHSEPQQDVHDASGDDRLHGILVQVAADRSLSPELDVRAAIADRLRDQQIVVDERELDELVRSLPGLPGEEPGPFIQGDGQPDAGAR